MERKDSRSSDGGDLGVGSGNTVVVLCGARGLVELEDVADAVVLLVLARLGKGRLEVGSRVASGGVEAVAGVSNTRRRSGCT